MNNSFQNTVVLLLSLALKKTYADFILLNYGVNEDKYFIDFSTLSKISFNNFKDIEKIMKKLISSGLKIEIKNIKNQQFAKVQDFQIEIKNSVNNSFSKIKHFKLLQIGGIENGNIRINFCAFDNQKKYEEYLIHLQNMEQRDHRKIGKDLSIFCFSEQVGQGLPLFLPNGAFIKNKISNYLKTICAKNGFELVSTPVLGSKQLYVTSGHWDLYRENNFPPIQVDNETYMLRPMTCPHHMIIFNNSKKTYKDLPLGFCEDSILHRYESSGGLLGLERVRTMELFDTHIFVRDAQIEVTIKKIYQMILEIYQKLEIKIDRIDLSLRSSEKAKFFNDDLLWQKAEKQLKQTLNEINLNYYEVKGEAAFYGPKIDFQYKTTHDKYITISTIQLDFLLPKKFNLEYLNENHEKETPIIIHLGLIGTYERFISCLLSQTKGVLPLWLSFNQVIVIPINEKIHGFYANKVFDKLKNHSIRVSIDNSNERLAKKIRNAQTAKIPFQVIIGDEEVKEEVLSYRKYGEVESNLISFVDFIKLFN